MATMRRSSDEKSKTIAQPTARRWGERSNGTEWDSGRYDRRAGNADTCTLASTVSVVCVRAVRFVRTGRIYFGCLYLLVWNVCRLHKGRCNAVRSYYYYSCYNFFSLSLSRFVRRRSGLPSVHASHHASRESSFLISFYFSWSHNYGCYIWYFFVRSFSQFILFLVRLHFADRCDVYERHGPEHGSIATGSRTKKGQSVWRIASLVCSCANERFFFVLLCFICSRQ